LICSNSSIGQGTVAVEFLEQVSDLDAILVPVSGGGLISGIALYAKCINPSIKIFACVPEGKMLDECLTAEKRLWPEPPQFLKTKCECILIHFLLNILRLSHFFKHVVYNNAVHLPFLLCVH
jgi:serine racemase